MPGSRALALAALGLGLAVGATGCGVGGVSTDPAGTAAAGAATASAHVHTATARQAPAPISPRRAGLVASPLSVRGRHALAVGGRTYVLDVPRKVRRPAPLVVAVSAYSWSRDHTLQMMRLHAQAAAAGAVVAYPDAVDGRWNSGGCCDGARTDDVRFLGAVRRDVNRRISIDRRRTVVMGYSNGGMLAYYAACRDSGWSAIVTVGATLTGRCRVRHAFSITTMNGTADQVVPWGGGYSANLRRALPAVWQVDQHFATIFGCHSSRQVRRPDSTWLLWDGCRGGVTVRDVRVPGLHHHWAVPEIDGWSMADVLWRFGVLPVVSA